MFVTKNTSQLDRGIRLCLGLALVIAALTFPPISSSLLIKIVVIAFAVINLISGLTCCGYQYT
jgi:hypothetical protein